MGRDGYWANQDATVTWEVVSYPVVRLTQGQGGFDAHLVRPGEVRISGAATPRYDEGRESFRGLCGIWLDDLRVTMTSATEFAFHPHPWSGLYACSSGRYGR